MGRTQQVRIHLLIHVTDVVRRLIRRRVLAHDFGGGAEFERNQTSRHRRRGDGGRLHPQIVAVSFAAVKLCDVNSAISRSVHPPSGPMRRVRLARFWLPRTSSIGIADGVVESHRVLVPVAQTFLCGSDAGTQASEPRLDVCIEPTPTGMSVSP